MANDMNMNLKEELMHWSRRVAQKIKRNFGALNINRGEKEGGFTGDLYRSIYWTVHSMAGGNEAAVTFFFMYYGQFVQWGVGGKTKKWDVPQMKQLEAIENPKTKRKAKPFLRSELTFHMRWLQERLYDEYSYGASYYLVRGLARGLNDQDAINNWLRDNQAELAKAHLSFV